uniref:Uncharacterized protein n=1 Tax=Arundo donax TaxID=35708 RepID=A0A0A9B6M7_ARUDO
MVVAYTRCRPKSGETHPNQGIRRETHN